jgi:predicted branched-subunit amino acid permease
MGAAERTAPRLVRDVAAIAVAAGAVGVSFGAIATAAGLPAWLVTAMSVLVFAGGSQFLAVGLIAAGNPVAAVLAGLLLNARHLPFGLAIAGSVFPAGSSGGFFGGWTGRLVGSHLMIDESVAFALAQPDPRARRRAYWLTGGVLFGSWNAGTLLGIAVGGAAGDPAALGLDAAFPAGLIALLLPSLRDRDTRRVALLGAAVAVLTTPLLPAGLPVLLALVGLAALALPVPSRREPVPSRREPVASRREPVASRREMVASRQEETC